MIKRKPGLPSGFALSLTQSDGPADIGDFLDEDKIALPVPPQLKPNETSPVENRWQNRAEA